MSWLSSATGIHISPKHGVHIEPLKALATVATLGSGGLLGPLAGAARAIPAAAKIGGMVKGAASVLGPLMGHGGSQGPQPMDEQGPPVIIGHNPDGSPIYGNVTESAGPGNAGPSAAGGGDRFRGIGDWLSGHKNDILDYGAAAEGVYDKYRQSKAQDEAMRLAKEDYGRRAPLRSAGMSSLLDQSRPDLSGVFNDPNDPQGRYRRVNVGSRV